MTDTPRTPSALIAMLSDGAAAHSTNRALLRDWLVSSFSAENLAVLQAAITAAGIGGSVPLRNEINAGSSRITKDKGVQFEGNGLLTYIPSATLGTRVQSPAGRNRVAWGSEYLYEFLVKVSAGTASTIRLSGDSTTAGGYSDQLISLLAEFPSIVVTKAGFSGEHTGQWLATRLAADIAAAPDVLIWHWGMNDCTGLGRTLTQFEADLRSGLASYRASIPISSGGIVLMTPNASSDGTNGRDEYRSEKMRQIIRNAAEDFQCAYFDTYTLFQDGYVGIGTWLDNTYGDGLRGVHPQTAFSRAIAGELLNLLIPQGIRRLIGEFGFTNSAGQIQTKTPTDLKSTYPAGISIFRAQFVNGWPIDGWVITIAENGVGNSAIQFLYKYNGDVTPWVRTSNSVGGWGTWGPVGVDNVKSNAAPLSTAANTAYPLGSSIRRATPANGFPIDGFVITYREDNLSIYALQVLHAYNLDTPPQMRTWTSLGAWSVWRAMGGFSIANTNKEVRTGSGGALAHTIQPGRQYTYLTNNTAAAAYALTLPAATTDGMLVEVVFANATGTITYTPIAPATATVGLPTTAAANVPIRMIYHSSTTSWYPA